MSVPVTSLHTMKTSTSVLALCLSVCLSVCLSQVGVLTKRMDGWGLLARRLPSTYSTLCYMEI